MEKRLNARTAQKELEKLTPWNEEVQRIDLRYYWEVWPDKIWLCEDWKRGLVPCAENQAGAFKVLDNAKKCADEHPRFSVFDEDGKAVYSSVDKKPEEVFRPYLVRVEIPDLNIRKKPGTDQEKTGKYTCAGCFTIVAEDDGVGASKLGLLKAYEKEWNGWISLDFVTRI